MPSPFPHPINVTRPYLPPLPEFQSALQEIWANNWLTNNGPVVERFERNAPLNEPQPATFYGGGAEGYTDYPALDAAKAA